MDYGTENGLIATTQIMFRSQHSDDLSGANSIRYGKSPANVVSLLCKNNTSATASGCMLLHRGLKAGGLS